MCTFTGEFQRPRLFNWLTVLLVSAWVLTVVVVFESTERQPIQDPDSVQTFIEKLLT